MAPVRINIRRLFAALAMVGVAELFISMVRPAVAPDLGSFWSAAVDAGLLVLVLIPVMLWLLDSEQSPAAGVTGLGDPGASSKATTRTWALAAGVLAVGLCMSAAVMWSSARAIGDAAKSDFEYLSNQVVTTIESRMNRYVDGLRGARGTFVVSEDVNRSAFRRYATSRDSTHEAPGLVAIGFIERVSREAVADFVRSSRADEAPGFAVTTTGNRSDLLLIKYLEPHTDDDAEALGIDLGAEPMFRLPAEEAMLSGQPTLATLPPALASRCKLPTNFYVLPVDRNGAPLSQDGQKEEALLGWVFAAFEMKRAMVDVASQSQDKIDFEVYDGPVILASKLMFDSDGQKYSLPSSDESAIEHRTFASSRLLNIGGRYWTVATSTTPKFDADVRRSRPAVLGVSGAIISVLLAALVYSMGRARIRAVTLATEMTAGLRASEAAANTSRQRVEQAMAELTAYQAAMDEHAIIAVTDPAGTILHVNDLFCKISGYCREELVGANHRLVNSGTHPRSFWTEMFRTVMGGQVWHAEVCNRAKNGSLYWVDTTVAPMRNEAGKIVRFVAIRADLTERKRSEKRLIDSERQARDLALIAEKANNASIITDAQGRIVWVNDGFVRITGYTLEEARGKRPGSMLQGPRTDMATVARMREAISEQVPFVVEIYNYGKDGREFWLHVDATPVFDGNGDLTHYVAVETDIHERKMAELLRGGQARVLEMLTGQSPLPVLLEEVCRVIEQQCPGSGAGASIMLLEGNTLRSTAGALTPDEYRVAVNGCTIGPTSGSCGVAAWSGSLVVTADMHTDPNWAAYRELTDAHDLRSCWSMPVKSALGEVLGTMALYHNRPATPTENDLRLLGEAARLAGIAIERRQTEHRLADMMKDVLHSRDESERQGVELVVRATEMEQLRDKAEEATAAKSAFLANMSHEIRTPLTAILGYADLLRDDGEMAAAPVRRLQTIETIRSAGQHLLTVINDILDLSKIEAGKMTVESIETSLPEIFQEVESLMRPRSAAKGVRLGTHLETPIPTRVLSDPTRLRQILMNLVGNAAKFTDHGSITLSAKVAGSAADPRLLIDIIDTGSGLHPDQAARLFSAFSQADESVTRKHGGTGLGLTICRRLAELMGGHVTLERSEPGMGSCFRIDLPLVAVAGSSLMTDVGSVLSGSGRPAAAQQAVRLTGRILLAEDGEDNQRLISFHLKKAGAEVEIAENGVIALERIRAAEAAGKPYDLLLTDMQMPEMDGYTLARTLRSAGSTLAIVALTAHAMAEDRAKCHDAGCDDYATKPIDKISLLSTCAKWMGQPGGLCSPANTATMLK